MINKNFDPYNEKNRTSLSVINPDRSVSRFIDIPSNINSSNPHILHNDPRIQSNNPYPHNPGFNYEKKIISNPNNHRMEPPHLPLPSIHHQQSNYYQDSKNKPFKNDENYNEKINGFEKLFLKNSITIKPHLIEKNDIREAVYYIFPGVLKDFKHNEYPIFSYVSKPVLCSKYCMTNDCRALNINIKHLDGREFLKLEKDCTFTCLCNGRPEFSIKYVEEGPNTQEFNLGKIYNPYVCLDYELRILDNNLKLKYIISAGNCTCNIYCSCPGEFCNKSKFFIKDPEYNNLSEIEIRTNYDCCSSLIHEFDYYVLNFPLSATREDRSLLIGSLIYLDQRYIGGNEN